MKRLKGIIIILFLGATAYSQNEVDVLRYSTTDIFGSARFEAMAGSFGGLGADLSVIQVNPGSLGRFSSSTASISVNNSFSKNSALFNGTETASQKNKVAIGSLGVVFANDLSRRNVGRRYNQITLGYTRLKNFTNMRSYGGQQFNSLLDVLAGDGAGIDPEFIYDDRPFTTGLAYDVYAVDYDNSTQEYYSRLTAGDMIHKRDIATEGGMGEFHIGYSENYMNKFYYGASIGIRRVNYSESFRHHEELIDTMGTSLRFFDYYYEQLTNGTGFNLKLGVLYLPIDEVRLGLAFESPTVIKLQDEWMNNMTAMHSDGLKVVESEFIPRGKFDYRIKTPMKLRGSFAYVFGMRGAVNVDLEMSRLPGGLLKADKEMGGDNLFAFENEEVAFQYRTVLNTRIGIEYMVARDFYLRGGIAILPQPYKKNIGNINLPNMTYSGGIGWENRFLYVDLSYRVLQLRSDYYAFDPSQIENRTEFKTNVHNIVLTAGFKF